jgi:preprotein translocase subunit YajC
MPDEHGLAENLNNVRKSHRLPKKPSGGIGMTPGQALALMAYINPFIDWLFGIALILAILKDILDFVGIGSLPGIGTVVTLTVSAIIGAVMFIAGSSAQSKRAKSYRKLLTLAAGTTVEMVFGVDFLPIETIMVIFIFQWTLEDRQAAAKEAEEARQQEEAYATA